MPHFKNGEKANVGDIVRGKGYNIKDENGELKEIVGVITAINFQTTSCNVTLLIPDGCLGVFIPAASGSQPTGFNGFMLTGRIEYGQADHFEKVQ